jgi:hypothetical protein
MEISISRVGFESKTPVSEQAKAVNALDSAAVLIVTNVLNFLTKFHGTWYSYRVTYAHLSGVLLESLLVVRVSVCVSSSRC